MSLIVGLSGAASWLDSGSALQAGIAQEGSWDLLSASCITHMLSVGRMWGTRCLSRYWGCYPWSLGSCGVSQVSPLSGHSVPLCNYLMGLDFEAMLISCYSECCQSLVWHPWVTLVWGKFIILVVKWLIPSSLLYLLFGFFYCQCFPFPSFTYFSIYLCQVTLWIIILFSKYPLLSLF